MSRGRCAGGRSGAAAKRGPEPIRAWIVGATGYRQGLDRPTGLERLWRDLRELSGPEVCVLTPQAWDDDAEALADYIVRNSARSTRVFFYGYSYGVGAWMRGFAEALQARGMGIELAVTIDGIRRLRWLKLLSLRWFARLVRIPVPANVAEVYAFRQSRDPLLRGHRLLAVDAAHTQVHDCPLYGCDHYNIDEAESVRRVVLTEARQLVERAMGGAA